MADNDLPTPAAPAAPAPRRPARIDRTLIGLNVLVQLAIVLFIVVVANIISYRHFHRWDLSHNQNYELSQKSKNLLAHLDKPVRAIVFFPQAQILSKDVYSLMREYEYASNKKFTVEYVDPYKNLTRARELAEKYKFGSNDNIVILDYETKSKFVNAADMAEVDTSGAMMGQPPTMRAFKGEEAITSALQSLTESKENKLYLLTGHGESALESGEINDFKEFVGRENITVASLNLNNVDSVPSDATGIMIFGPKLDISDREMELISNYWDQKKGRLFVLLNPVSKTPRLDMWLEVQGAKPQNDRVMKVGTGLSQENGKISLVTGPILAAFATFAAEGRSVTKDLAGADIQLLGASESLLVNPTQTQSRNIKSTVILQSAEGFWGETEYVPGETRNVFFDPKKDHMGPLTVGVALEKGGIDMVKVDTSRMVVLGNSGFLTDKGQQMSQAGIDFALFSINWLFNREAISGITPKPKIALTLSLDDKMMAQIFYLTVIGIPLLAGLFGLYVSWFRRNRNVLQLTAWLVGIGLFIAGLIWVINLWISSRELGATSVQAKDFLIPSTMIGVAIVAFLLRLWRSSAAPEIAAPAAATDH